MQVLGFTGTQSGMTGKQKHELLNLLIKSVPFRHAHHGDCIGADAEFHALLRTYFKVEIHGHIPDNDSKRAFCDFDETFDPRPYLVRNKNIVYCSTLMIACPAEETEQLRSGTWSTIRYARKVEKPLFIIFPDGRISEVK